VLALRSDARSFGSEGGMIKCSCHEKKQDTGGGRRGGEFREGRSCKLRGFAGVSPGGGGNIMQLQKSRRKTRKRTETEGKPYTNVRQEIKKKAGHGTGADRQTKRSREKGKLRKKV